MGNIKTLFANFTEIIKTKKNGSLPIVGMTVGGVILAVYLWEDPEKMRQHFYQRKRVHCHTREYHSRCGRQW